MEMCHQSRMWVTSLPGKRSGVATFHWLGQLCYAWVMDDVRLPE